MNLSDKMAQQIELQRTQSAYDHDSVQQLQQELDQENLNLQRMTSTEERADRQKMRRIFNSVRMEFAVSMEFAKFLVSVRRN